MEIKDKFLENKDLLPVYGLGLFMLTAGASKFFILDFWLGYEPQFIVNFLPMTAKQLTILGGGFEAILGLALLSRKKVAWVSGLTAIWLGTITLQVARLGMWGLAIRDFGLLIFALSVLVLYFD